MRCSMLLLPLGLAFAPSRPLQRIARRRPLVASAEEDGAAGASAEDAYRAQFATVHREFHRQSAFLFAYLSNMSSPQASPHLAQLLLRLNFNSFFQAASDGDAGAGPSGGVAAGGP